MLCLQAQKTLFLTQKTQYVVSSKNLQSISSAVIMCLHSKKHSAQRNVQRIARTARTAQRTARIARTARTAQYKAHSAVQSAQRSTKRTARNMLICNACTLPSKQRPVKARQVGDRCKACRLYHRRANSLHSIHKLRVAYEGQVETQVYWRTLKSKYRAVRIQLHHRVTVVLPAPVV